MKGGDIDNKPVPIILVVDEAVTKRESVKEEKKTWLGRKHTILSTIYIPDLDVLGELWKFSTSSDYRMELAFLGDEENAEKFFEEIDATTVHPFNGWMAVENRQEFVKHLAHRPDVRWVIDTSDSRGLYGGRGITVAHLRG